MEIFSFGERLMIYRITFHIKAFEKEIEKEALYLKTSQPIKTRELARFLTFQVLCCIMVLLDVSVPSRTALRRISFALFLDLTIILSLYIHNQTVQHFAKVLL